MMFFISPFAEERRPNMSNFYFQSIFITNIIDDFTIKYFFKRESLEFLNKKKKKQQIPKQKLKIIKDCIYHKL